MSHDLNWLQHLHFALARGVGEWLGNVFRLPGAYR
jgi:hypothetical protein